MSEEFTFWEAKSVKLPMGPVWSMVIFPAIAMVVITILSTIFGTMTAEEKKGSSGPSMEELKGVETIIASGDPTKMSETIRDMGAKVGADAEKWKLVNRWQNKTMFELYQSDLLGNVRSQIDALRKAQEAMERAARAKAAQEAAGSSGAAAPTKAP